MALPVASKPHTNDVASTGWAAVTVRVAWTLLTHNVRVQPGVLRDARDNALYAMDPLTSLNHAEDRASALTERFIARARGKDTDIQPLLDAEMPVSPRWRRALDTAQTPESQAVFTQHYGNQRSFAHLEKLLQLDPSTLEAARAGLREIVRHAAHLDDVPVADWPDERIDRLLTRLAAYAPGPCPPVLDVLEGAHAHHVAQCVRCDRTRRLVQAGVITPEDLLPPSLEARPKKKVRVLALQIHPEARKARGTLAKELPVPCQPVGDDLLLVDFPEDQAEAVAAVLRLASEVGYPRRDQMRGSLLMGPGHWSAAGLGLLGPLGDLATSSLRGRSWGEVEGIGPLPDELPEPPSARRAWASVALLAAALAVVIGVVVDPMVAHASLPLDVQFTEGRGGVWSEFDVDEQAVVTVIREVDGDAMVVLQSQSPIDKGNLATGDGRYRVHSMGPAALVASTRSEIEGLTDLIVEVNRRKGPTLEILADRIRILRPDADVRVFRSPDP